VSVCESVIGNLGMGMGLGECGVVAWWVVMSFFGVWKLMNYRHVHGYTFNFQFLSPSAYARLFLSYIPVNIFIKNKKISPLIYIFIKLSTYYQGC
jgi:hypothetical protein